MKQADKTATHPFVLVDGSSYLYRAFHALPALNNSRGQPTGAVYGVVNMLLKLLREYEPEHVAVLFDARGKTFRDELYAEYKAQRPPMPDELRSQIRPLHEIVRALGLPLVQVEGVEADDVIGTLVRLARAQGRDVIVSTIDKDMAQLVGEGVTLVNTMFDTQLDRERVHAKFGVAPEQIVDYIALVGDTSDNIPGVPGIGQKSAAALLQAFDSIEGIYENLDKLGEAKVRGAARLGDKLEAHRDDVALSQRLAALRCDVPLDRGPAELTRGEPDVDRLRELYTELEFGTLLKQLPGRDVETGTRDGARRDSGGGSGRENEQAPRRVPDAPAPPARTHYETISDEAGLEALLRRLRAADTFALEVMASDRHHQRARLVGLALAPAPGEAGYIPLDHRYTGVPEQLDTERVLRVLAALLEADTPAIVGHDLKFAAHVLAHHGVALRGALRDAMLESYVLNSTAMRHEREGMALSYLKREITPYESIAGKGARAIGFAEVAVEQASEYACEMADVTLQLETALHQRLEATPALLALYDTIEQPLEPVLQRMEACGVLVDVAQLEAQSGELGARLAELEQAVYDSAGTEFNLGSPKQLQEVLFGTLALPVRRKTRTGQPSTAEDVLEELAAEFELPALIIEHRGVAKLKSTYCDTLPRQVDPATGRVHTSYHQAVAATGRLSSSDPNLQNIPIRTPEGRRVRQAFVAPEGSRIVAADYSQIELRIMAHLSGDASLLEAFAERRDIHQATASEVFGVPLDSVDPEQRRSAKAINFGLIYGMSAFGLARQLGIDRKSAAEYVALYFERYPGVKRFMDATRTQARELGYVETVFGRRLYLPEIRSRNHQRRQYAERSAINAPMQGTAADIIKRAMIAVDAWIEASGTGARLIMQVHDELVLEVPRDAVEGVAAEVSRLMSGAAELEAPLEVEVGVGENWDQAH